MGEWNRARDAIHTAETCDDREAAIDVLWKLARQSVVADIEAVLDDIGARVTGERDPEPILLGWIRDRLETLYRC